ncbi:DUF3488 and DUF4129 domain-containing transglutaminase family protein [Desulfonatronum sp. SC1]|uniref:transglutaminase TgpA family protein n=1 Tax=Desulfonatronum sp. SC1 TaxID=2109626 RepID=UPI000D2F7F66|nr:transglutaminaseTgpA domain-containing protein [Desulfonatronum sp. SC1]PTN36354.1 DUF3488 domain-containing protein [Desulfonatronum sp. SC1]
MMLRALRTLLRDPHGSWLWILGPALLASLPHFARYPAWIGLTCIGLWTLWLSTLRHPKLKPPRMIRFALTLGCVGGVFLSFGYLLGPEPGTALLLLLLALKPLEAKGRRDQIQILFMTYLLVLLQFLHSQSLLVAGYMILVVLIATAALVGVSHPASQTNPRFRLRQAGILLLQALPVMLILFVLFPRLPGSLWGLFQTPRTGLTGLSDTMNPGDISELLQSSEVVFRVAFVDQPPTVSRMYWRALVLWETDGRAWRVGEPDRASDHKYERDFDSWRVRALGEPVEYVLTMEAHDQRWLPVLEMPLTKGWGGQLSSSAEASSEMIHETLPDTETETPGVTAEELEPAPDFRIEIREELRRRARFQLQAALEFETNAPTRLERRRALALPPSGNERARELARKWVETSTEERAVVDQALFFFRDEAFGYTLRPPLLGKEAVDDFLFRTRSGYCEHYASAFTFLMRAAGIPARVVVGYQGGDRNPLGDYFVIRQYNAHAWSEVWLEETGWTRVDPTTVLAPERIDVGAGALVPNIDMPRMLSSREVGWVINAWRGLTQGWDAANTLWNQWVLDFDFERQRRFLERFGLAGTTRLERFGHLALALSLSFVAAALIYGVILLRSRPPEDALDKIYSRFCRRLAKIGIPRLPQEGPRDFALRATGVRPDLAEPITAISEGYIQLRYGESPSSGRDAGSLKAQQDELIRMVRAFRPKRA